MKNLIFVLLLILTDPLEKNKNSISFSNLDISLEKISKKLKK